MTSSSTIWTDDRPVARRAVTPAPIRVAVLGAGTVGEQVVRRLLDESPPWHAPLVLAGVAVRNVDRAIDRGLPRDLLTDAPAHLVAAPDVDLIVELMGGDEPARTLIAAALGAGKPVVTANKHVVAHHGPSLEAIARRSGAVLRFEAAVGGGIPVLGPLAADLAANRVTRVRGIVNGTTNYILSEMAAGRGTYDEVLRAAQHQGYAEADPSGDVEGRDAVNKLVILARLALDRWIDPADVGSRPAGVRGARPRGITAVTSDELAGAAALGLAIRLLARVERDGPASVLPTAVPAASPLGATSGVRNRIEVRAEPVGDVGFDGPGAGGAATSSAVLGDVLAIARGAGSTWDGRPVASLDPTRSPEASHPPESPPPRPLPWFALLPGARVADVRRSALAAHRDMPAGLAVVTRPMPAVEACAALAPAVADTADTTLYPVDD